MSEPRRKSHVVLLKFRGKASIKVELFPASEWTGEDDGLWRVRIDGRWHVPAGAGNDGQGYLAAAGVEALVARLLFGQAEVGREAPDAAWSVAGREARRVRAPLRVEDGLVLATEIAFALAPPVQGLDGRWRLPVAGYGGRRYVCVEDCDLLEE